MTLSKKDIEALVSERAAAKDRGDSGEAYRIQTQLRAAGYVLEDGEAGTTWKKSPAKKAAPKKTTPKKK